MGEGSAGVFLSMRKNGNEGLKYLVIRLLFDIGWPGGGQIFSSDKRHIVEGKELICC